jgi:hypothetical protein
MGAIVRRFLLAAGGIALAGVAVACPALAQTPPPGPPTPAPAPAPGPAQAATPAAPAPALPATAVPSPGAPPPAAAESDLERRLRELEAANRRMREELDDMKDDHKDLRDKVTQLLPLTTRVSGFIDFGAFYVSGDGSGVRPDIGHVVFPQYNENPMSPNNVPDKWVFMGDPLAPTINARGDVASTGPSRAVVFDPVGNGGKPSFIVNSIDLAIFEGVGDNLTINGAVDFLPRSFDPSNAQTTAGNFGSYIDVRLAYGEFIVPVKTFDLSLFAGKFDSVLGVEYRTQDAAQRLTVTPSLICRYTCGYPLGLKARAKFFDEKIIINAAVTNDSSFVDNFPFYSETSTTNMKTGSARISTKLPVGSGLEIGVSGAYGAQAFQTDDTVAQYQYGADISLDWHDIIVAGEVVHGEAEGAQGAGDIQPCTIAPCLHFTGAYGLLGYRLFNWLTPYARVDGRDALHRNGASFVYITSEMRTTGGLHFEFGTNVILKAEYTHIIELGSIPQFPDDVATSSLVLKY